MSNSVLKTIEVATFRRQVEPGQLTVETDTTVPAPDDVIAPDDMLPGELAAEADDADADPVAARPRRPPCSTATTHMERPKKMPSARLHRQRTVL